MDRSMRSPSRSWPNCIGISGTSWPAALSGLSDLIGCVVGERQPPAVGVSIVAGLATISTRALGAVAFTAEVLGSGIWCGCCNPRTTRHETEELRLEVLNIRHEPHPPMIPTEPERENSSVVPPSKPGESAIGSQLI